MKETIENIYARCNFGDLSGYQTGEIKRALAAAYRAGRKGGLTKRAVDGAYVCPHCGQVEEVIVCWKCGGSKPPRN